MEEAFKGLAKALRTRKRRQGDGNRTPDGKRTVEVKRLPKRMPRKDLPCFTPHKLPASKYPEMDRQLKGQEQGLNDMSVEEYIKAREAFDPKNRDRSVAADARAKFSSKVYAENWMSSRIKDFPSRKPKSKPRPTPNPQ
ncbi:polymorphic toxin type 15 domain-containing protein [Stenotrophomonas sp.]|uniref:polymorphic toxin type 15 domain-containing protein n=1 Tax=Stenotrophomonas sp. TaxID=69392 RepID=UPI0028A62A0B|nr:polymorphic toxin type 15 domain-containing protein [Stenotrophomonas sp.]